jgi:hypothetical protein
VADLNTITQFVLETDKVRRYETPLAEVTRNLKTQLECGVDPNSVLPVAFAAVLQACRNLLGREFPVLGQMRQ